MPPKPPLGMRLAMIAFAAFFAVLLPWEWIDYSDKALHRGVDLNFHPLAIVLYAPLAFGLIWPVMIFVLMRGDAGNLAWPKKTALILFGVCSLFSVPIIVAEASSLSSGLEKIRLDAVALGKTAAEFKAAKLRAKGMLESKGIDSLQDPLGDAETAALDDYMENPPLAPSDFVVVSQKYRTAVEPMLRMAKSKSCPPQALDIIFENVLELRERSLGFPTSDMVEAIANNPNASPSLLVRIVQTPRLFGQASALTNPRLPANEKLAYLERCAESKDWRDWQTAANNPDTPPSLMVKLLEVGDYSVSSAVSNPKVPEASKVAYVHKMAMSDDARWRMWAAENPFCPPDDLKRLVADRATTAYAASNPKLPIELLEPLTHSQDQNIRTRALRNMEQ